jgi:SAM-dependent methyltransferase
MAPEGRSNPASTTFLAAGGRIFPLSTREIAVGGLKVPLAGVPYTPKHLERLTEGAGLRERDWPYWLEDWPAAHALAEVLDSVDPAALKGPILDLGCGSGFLAAYLRLRFGLPAFSCDFNPDACRLAWLNAGGRVICADFVRFPSRTRFGLVLAGDLLYARGNQTPLLVFLENHLAPGGSAWLADPGRSAAAGFAQAAVAAGFRTRRERCESAAADRNVDVYILDRPGEVH